MRSRPVRVALAAGGVTVAAATVGAPLVAGVTGVVVGRRALRANAEHRRTRTPAISRSTATTTATEAMKYAKAAIDGKTFQPGPTDHDSTIIKVRDGLLEDQLSAPLVTADAATIGGEKTAKYDDTSLWGNNS